MSDEVIQGFGEFERKLNELKLSQQKSTLVESAKAGAAVALEALKSAAPRDSGVMVAGLRARVNAKDTDANEATVQIKPSNKGWYWFLTNTGTRFMPGSHWADNAIEGAKGRIVAAMKARMLLALEKFR